MLVSDIPTLAAHRKPNVAAITYRDEVIPYAAFRDRCWRLSNALFGVAQPGDRVAILSENCPEYADCYYGVPGAGMALTMLNYRLTGRELAYIIGNAEARILVVERKYLDTIRSIRAEIPSVERILLIDGDAPDCESYAAFRDSGAASEPSYRPAETDLCWLIYTSGTTGLPKGAMLSHRNLLTAVLNSACTWEMAADEVYMFTFPQFHVAGYILPLVHLKAIPVVLLKTFDAETLLTNVERHRVTNTGMAPTMIGLLLEDPRTNDYDLSSLRRIGYGASAMPAEVLRKARRQWPRVDFSTGFGMTELAGNVMILPSADLDRGAQNDLPMVSSVGKEMPLSRVRVVDEDGRDVPVGEPGELVIKGDQVLTGYWRNPEATAASFFEGGWFRSGDVARWDEDGYLYIVDRKKDMILTGGENVYPREVEEVLFTHPAVVEAAVIGVPDPLWGEKVVAVVVARDGENVGGDDLIVYVRERIASYKKPKAVIFIDALPKNASGKVLKRELRDRAAAGEWVLDG